MSKQKKCKQCGNLFYPDRPLQYICSFQCSLIYSSNKSERLEVKSWAKEKAKMKDNLKTHSEYEADLQKEINSIVRLIDKGSNCMMCGNKPKKVNACHYHSVGSNNSLRFNLFNNWLGCESCNSYKGGNINGYDVELLKHYSEVQWKYIKFDLVRLYPFVKLSKEDLKYKTKLARTISKSLEIKDLRYNIEDRWGLRKQLNLIIGIYLD